MSFGNMTSVVRFYILSIIKHEGSNMKTKIVYVVVSSPDDIYLEQAYISMYSLKYYMPDAHIVLLTDKLTSETLTGIRKEKVRYVDEMKVIDLDGSKYNAQQRSRQLKTSIRNLIEGDFLFIDCDTIITRILDDIEHVNAPIAACYDSHCLLKDNPYREMNLRMGRQLDFPLDHESVFFNSGVIYVKDVPVAHEFYRLWNIYLNQGYQYNVYKDQPSFAKTNYEMNHIVHQLDDEWNCELKHGMRYLKDAYIVHYLCTNASQFQNEQLFIFNEKSVLLEVKETGILSEKIIEVIKDPFKGLAKLTHCFSGDDVYFFSTQEYQFVRKHFKRGGKSRLFLILRLFNLVERLVYRYVRIAQGRATFKTPW